MHDYYLPEDINAAATEPVSYRTFELRKRRVATHIDTVADYVLEEQFDLEGMMQARCKRYVMEMMIPVYEYTVDYETYATWWDHFKSTSMPKWMRGYFDDPKMVKYEKTVSEFREDFPAIPNDRMSMTSYVLDNKLPWERNEQD